MLRTELPSLGFDGGAVSRWPLAVYAALIGVAAFLLWLLGWHDFWSLLRERPLNPHFADMRTIQAAIHSAAIGIDPQIANPTDPWQRAMNYPLLWMRIARALSLQNETYFLVFCTVMVAAFFAATAYLVHRSGSWLLVVAALSPSAQLAVERGNIDMIAFALLVVFATQSRWALPAYVGAVATKFYPVFAVYVLVVAGHWRKALLYGALGALVILSMFAELAKIRAATWGNGALSYGALPLYDSLREVLPPAAGLAMFAVVLSASLLIAFRYAPTQPLAGHYEFVVGAAVFLGTYLASPNWNYRMICLFLCIPFLRHTLYGRVTCWLIIIALFSGLAWDSGPVVALVVQLLKLVMACLLVPCVIRPLLQQWTSWRVSAAAS